MTEGERNIRNMKAETNGSREERQRNQDEEVKKRRWKKKADSNERNHNMLTVRRKQEIDEQKGKRIEKEGGRHDSVEMKK